jgi:TRAP-type C4-dicarboxylate transport system permease small subunit
MKTSSFEKSVTGFGASLNLISSAALLGIMFLTCLDVSMRYFFNRPIPGTYELVGIMGAVVASFAMPYTMLERGHVAVEILIKSLSVRKQLIIETATHLLGILFFLVLVWQSIELGLDMKRAGEITPTLHIPFYPIIYLIALCFFGLCLAILRNLIQIWKKAYR